MNKIKKALLTLGLAAGLAVGGTAVVAPVTAERAEAYTNTQCYYWSGQTPPSYAWTRYRTCYYDYNFWEEMWGYRDGWYYEALPKYV